MFVPHVLGRFAVKGDTVLAGVSKKKKKKKKEARTESSEDVQLQFQIAPRFWGFEAISLRTRQFAAFFNQSPGPLLRYALQPWWCFEVPVKRRANGLFPSACWT